MRIAIHPVAQRRGLGATLLQAIARHASEQGIDFLGSSFGADPELLRFWQHNGYQPARLSARPSASSGSHSAIVVRALSENGHALTTLATQRFRKQFPIQLGDHLSGLDSRLALQLLASTSAETRTRESTELQQQLDQQDWLELFAFGRANRVYEDCLQPLSILSRHALTAPDCPLTPPQRQLLMTRVLQQRPWEEVAALADLSGRKQVIAALRRCVDTLLQHHAGASAKQLASTLLTPPQ